MHHNERARAPSAACLQPVSLEFFYLRVQPLMTSVSARSFVILMVVVVVAAKLLKISTPIS